MKTFADLKRRLKPGVVLKMTRNDWCVPHGQELTTKNNPDSLPVDDTGSLYEALTQN